MKAVAITAFASGQGKTLVTMAFLNWFKTKNSVVRAFKVGPDYIDPQFHKKILGLPSVNLDLYMMNNEELNRVFQYYIKDTEVAIVEGVMGFYDGMDYGSSTYDVTRSLKIPSILVVSPEGSYSTVVAIIKGIKEYRPDNTIKAVILNKISSEKHYKVIADQIRKDLPGIKTLGWIEKGAVNLSSRHLGLDLTELNNNKLDELTKSIMKNIDTEKLLDIMDCEYSKTITEKHFIHDSNKYIKLLQDKSLTVVFDKAFSFIYEQNTDFFKKVFRQVNYISALEDQEIPEDTDVLYIPGGYVETPEVAYILDKSEKFKASLVNFASNPQKKIFAECAGLMFLGNRIQTTDGNSISGAGILPLSFEMQKKRHRLGYYKAINLQTKQIYKGHAFHYSVAVPDSVDLQAVWGIFKDKDSEAIDGAWTNKTGNVLGTYLHSFFYNQPDLIMKYFAS